MKNLELKGIFNPPTLADDIPEFLDATNQIDSIYGDEKLIPIGNWGGDSGKLVSFFYV